MPSGSLPVTLRLTGRRVLVVGGGRVATKRVRAFLDAGADVVVVSPEASEPIAALAASGELVWHARGYTTSDVDGAWLVQTATGSAVDDQVAADAEERRIWCFKGGDPEAATAWMPAVARADDVTVSVCGGGDAGRAKRLRDEVALSLDTGGLPLRHRTRHPGGRVALIGGGPGDPDLLSARGRRLLAEADVVVVDRLAPLAVLDKLDPDVEVVDVGKHPDHHPVPQEEINQILIEHARTGKVVARLKGGDPYVFGRGGEERLACEAAGVPVEVVPGVTSAISVPAAAGIPVTHRGVAASFSVVTGHDQLAQLPVGGDHTIVMLMGVRRLATTTAELIAAGHSPDTPVAVVERGYAPDQRVTVGTLADIAEKAAAVGATSPAVTVIGDVVPLSPHWP
ncbi:MAG: uroporphyrinogen-III C-methyltransferase [Aeromicrobium sp.]|uniref:uroporphyrinogen-III C-methyltransferase n=1 Tax=Aeromicrobium sp. TaxID=1871063 RepID=UPI0039E3314D